MIYNQNAVNAAMSTGGASFSPPASGSYWPESLTCSGCVQQTIYFTSQSSIQTYVGVTYGRYTHVSFSPNGVFTIEFPQLPEAEDLYPASFSPASFVTDLQQNAPIHWQGLIDSGVHSYGDLSRNRPSIQYRWSMFRYGDTRPEHQRAPILRTARMPIHDFVRNLVRLGSELACLTQAL